MFGNDDSGQLALMDAMIFFIGCIAVSSVLFSMIVGTSPDIQTGCGLEAENVLAVFMHSSIGSEIAVGTSGIVLARTESVADCLLLEVHFIAEGDDPSHFDSLNSRFLEILSSVCGPFVKPSLVMFDLSDGTPIILNSVPSDWEDSGTVYAASEGLSDNDGRTYSVQLRLVEGSGPEFRRVGFGDLDPRSG